jgi:uncharacterized ion transporter superfamily protein YfcC
MPDTYLVIGAVALLAYALSFLLTPGLFSVVEQLRDGTLVPVIDPDSFRFVEGARGLPLFSSDGSPALFNAIFEGLVSGDLEMPSGWSITDVPAQPRSSLRRRR